jgi:hypothetical protein
MLQHALKHATSTSSNIVDNSAAYYEAITIRSALLQHELASQKNKTVPWTAPK